MFRGRETMQKHDKKKWEEVDKETVAVLTAEFRALIGVYSAQGVDPIAIASALLGVGQWAMKKEIGLKETQDLLKLLSTFKYSDVRNLSDTIH